MEELVLHGIKVGSIVELEEFYIGNMINASSTVCLIRNGKFHELITFSSRKQNNS